LDHLAKVHVHQWFTLYRIVERKSYWNLIENWRHMHISYSQHFLWYALNMVPKSALIADRGFSKVQC
jgi:hypothetical protein